MHTSIMAALAYPTHMHMAKHMGILFIVKPYFLNHRAPGGSWFLVLFLCYTSSVTKYLKNLEYVPLYLANSVPH